MKIFLFILFSTVSLTASEYVHTVTDKGIYFKVESKGGTYHKPLPERITIPEGAETQWDGETLTLAVTVTTPSEVEGEEPTVETTTYEITESEIAAAWAYVPPPPELPLRERVKAVASGFPPEVLSAFPFERADYWFDESRPDVVKAIIEAVDVSGMSQSIQDAKAAMLAEFPAEQTL